MKKYFLPGGLVLAIILSAIFPDAGKLVKEYCGSSLFIILIFLVSGWQLEVGNMRFDRKFLLHSSFAEQLRCWRLRGSAC